jgi:hypothetical protein
VGFSCVGFFVKKSGPHVARKERGFPPKNGAEGRMVAAQKSRVSDGRMDVGRCRIFLKKGVDGFEGKCSLIFGF